MNKDIELVEETLNHITDVHRKQKEIADLDSLVRDEEFLRGMLKNVPQAQFIKNKSYVEASVDGIKFVSGTGDYGFQGMFAEHKVLVKHFFRHTVKKHKTFVCQYGDISADLKQICEQHLEALKWEEEKNHEQRH